MKRQTPIKDFARYASLNVLGMLGLSCYILADTFFVAKGLGANGLAALNLAIPIYSFIHGCGLMLGVGGGTKYSILQSQQDTRGANRMFTHAAILAATFAAFFSLIGMFLSAPVTRLLGADETVFAMSKIYVRMILLFSPMFLLNNLLLSFIRNDGKPGLSMLAMLAGSFSNIILDYIFIFPMQMGIFGAVLATGLAPVISILTLLPHIMKKNHHFRFIKCRFSINQSSSMLACGFPSLVTELSSGIVMIVFNAIILHLQGNVGVAAYGIIANLSLVVLAIYTGIAQGIQPLLSKNHGAQNRRNIRFILRYALTAAAALSLIIYAVMSLGAEQITNAFNSEGNSSLQEIAVQGLRRYFTACLFAGFNILFSVYFTSTDHALPAHFISLTRGFLLILPMVFLLAATGGMIGIWWAFPATEMLVCLAASVYIITHSQQQKPNDQ